MIRSFASTIISIFLLYCVVDSKAAPLEWGYRNGQHGYSRKFRTCTYRPKKHPPFDPNPVNTIPAETIPVHTTPAASPPVEPAPPNPSPVDACVHGPNTRHCWHGDFSIDTDMDLSWPDTGNTVKAGCTFAPSHIPALQYPLPVMNNQPTLKSLD